MMMMMMIGLNWTTTLITMVTIWRRRWRYIDVESNDRNLQGLMKSYVSVINKCAERWQNSPKAVVSPFSTKANNEISNLYHNPHTHTFVYTCRSKYRRILKVMKTIVAIHRCATLCIDEVRRMNILYIIWRSWESAMITLEANFVCNINEEGDGWKDDPVARNGAGHPSHAPPLSPATLVPKPKNKTFKDDELWKRRDVLPPAYSSIIHYSVSNNDCSLRTWIGQMLSSSQKISIL